MSTKNFFWIMGILVFGFAITSHLVQAKPLGAADKRVEQRIDGTVLARVDIEMLDAGIEFFVLAVF